MASIAAFNGLLNSTVAAIRGQSFGPLSIGGGAPPPPPGQVTVTMGTDTFGVGFRGAPGAYGAADTVTPNPPTPPGNLLQISQFGSLIWQIRFEPAVIAQGAWTSVTITGGAGPIVLMSAAATYTANSFGSSLWSFAATVDVWNGLPLLTVETATFA